MTVVPASKSSPDSKTGSSGIPVVTIDDGDDGGELSVDEDGVMDVSGGSRKRKMSPSD